MGATVTPKRRASRRGSNSRALKSLCLFHRRASEKWAGVLAISTSPQTTWEVCKASWRRYFHLEAAVELMRSAAPSQISNWTCLWPSVYLWEVTERSYYILDFYPTNSFANMVIFLKTNISAAQLTPIIWQSLLCYRLFFFPVSFIKSFRLYFFQL